MKRQWVLASLLGMLWVFANHCNAAIAKEEISLGEISLPNRVAAVRSMYGNPARRVKGPNGKLFYGKDVEIDLEDGIVTSIYTWADNGWRTPSGLAVGMSMDDARKRYGTPDLTEQTDRKSLYIYFVNPKYQSGGILGIVCDKKEKIRKLGIKTSAMAEFSEYGKAWAAKMLR